MGSDGCPASGETSDQEASRMTVHPAALQAASLERPSQSRLALHPQEVVPQDRLPQPSWKAPARAGEAPSRCHLGSAMTCLGDVAVDGGGADPETSRELNIRLTGAEVGERKQGLSAPLRRRQRVPRTRRCSFRRAVKSAGQSWTRRRRTGRQTYEASGGDGSPGRKPIYQGLHPSVRPTAHPTDEIGNGSLYGWPLLGPASAGEPTYSIT